MRRTGTLAAAAAVIFATAAAARADEARERALERRLAEVEARLAQVEDKGGYFTATSDLAARVSELERSLSADDKGAMTTLFKQGMRTETADGANSYRWLGFVQNDWVWYWDQGNEDVRAAGLDRQNAEFGFRRVRLGVDGKYYGNVKWQAVMDFAGGSVRFADVFMEIINCNFGSLRVGHFKHPWGMESLESDLYNHFIERGAVDRAFGMARDTGVMMHGPVGDSFGYQAGIFRNANAAGDDLGSPEAGEYNLTARLFGRPIIEDDGATWVHLGIAAAYRDFDGTTHDAADTLTLAAGAPIPFSTALGSAALTSDDGWQWGFEAAYVSGPFTARGEYARFSAGADNTRGAAGTSVDFDAWSLEAAYWLTGESTQYSKDTGTFGRPKPKKNYGDGDGNGAWQIAFRIDSLDLSDGDVTGEEVDSTTLGLNWWLNPNTRIAFNWVRADYDVLDESQDALVFRFQFDF